MTHNSLPSDIPKDLPDPSDVDNSSSGLMNPEESANITRQITRDVLMVSRSKEVTPKEYEFVGRVATMTSRNIIYCLDGNKTNPVDPEASERWINDIANNAYAIVSNGGIEGSSAENMPSTDDVKAGDIEALKKLLSNMTQMGISADKEYLMGAYCEYARAVAEYFDQMIDSTGGIDVDDYIEGNLISLKKSHDGYKSERTHKDHLNQSINNVVQRMRESASGNSGEPFPELVNYLSDRIAEMRMIDPNSKLAMQLDRECIDLRNRGAQSPALSNIERLMH